MMFFGQTASATINTSVGFTTGAVLFMQSQGNSTDPKVGLVSYSIKINAVTGEVPSVLVTIGRGSNASGGSGSNERLFDPTGESFSRSWSIRDTSTVTSPQVFESFLGVTDPISGGKDVININRSYLPDKMPMSDPGTAGLYILIDPINAISGDNNTFNITVNYIEL